MNSANQCMQASDIDVLLSGDVSDAQREALEGHIASCETCRDAMESRIADHSWWLEAEESLRGSSWEILNDTAPLDFHIDRESTKQLLKLLGPTDDPRMLGRIGNYEVLGVLGRGGMGIVFKAFDAALNRYVAIKMLLPHLAASGAARKRFEREGQAAAAVIDDHVLPIYSVAQWQGVPYLVMQYSVGANLQRRIERTGPLELKEVLRIGLQATRGLAAAHAQGLVHRDIKPSNILLDGTVERVLLTDFGLARAVDDASITRTGVIAGTPQYMSPEQARGRFVDARSDLFSLGCVLYAMCSGHPPFRADNSFAILRLITDEEPRPIREINADIPEWLSAVIGKLMAKQPDERYASAEEVAALLERCLAHVNAPLENLLPRIVSNSSQLNGWAQIMNEKRILSLFALILFVAGIVLPWPIAAMARGWELTQMFTGSALLMALFFAVLSRGEYLSQLLLKTVGLVLLGAILFQPLRLNEDVNRFVMSAFSRSDTANLATEVADPTQLNRNKASVKAMVFFSDFESRLNVEVPPKHVIALQVGASTHNQPLEWTSTAINGGEYSVTVAKAKVRLQDGTLGPGFTFKTADANGSGGTSYIAMTERDPLPGGKIEFVEHAYSETFDPNVPLEIARIKYKDGESAPVYVVIRASSQSDATTVPLTIDGPIETETDEFAPISKLYSSTEEFYRETLDQPFHDAHELADKILKRVQ